MQATGLIFTENQSPIDELTAELSKLKSSLDSLKTKSDNTNKALHNALTGAKGSRRFRKSHTHLESLE